MDQDEYHYRRIEPSGACRCHALTLSPEALTDFSELPGMPAFRAFSYLKAREGEAPRYDIGRKWHEHRKTYIVNDS